MPLFELNPNIRELDIDVFQLQVFRKRYNSGTPCNRDITSNIDIRWREELMKKVNCIPTYWKYLERSIDFKNKHINDCTTSAQYQSFWEQTTYERGKVQYEPSCTSPTIIKTWQKGEDFNTSWNVWVKINYKSEYYMEVVNYQATTLDDLFCQIGGLVGIFLGYSLLQFPEVLYIGIVLIQRGQRKYCR